MNAHADGSSLPSPRAVVARPGQFPDPTKAKNDMDEFADANENRLIKLLKAAMDPQTDLKTLVKINVRLRCLVFSR